ncbi:uncharacterized protein LOC142759803 isoform X3 [Rhinoderma darwinii]|uniref:uncharacterized protein LOC142759803 isoform X3 n=1 Tax=Rhinoderma darwinii TaxID=43563 RepID=UPI003F66C394
MKASSSVPKFLTKIWALVEDPRNSEYICWSQDGNSFIVLDEERFAKEILPRHFKHNNMASFVRQLNWYGFHKVMQDDTGAARHDKYCSGRYQHQSFKRGHEELLSKIKRKVTTSTGDKRVIRKAKVTASQSFEQIATLQTSQPLMIDSTGNYNQLAMSKTSQNADQAFDNRSAWSTDRKPTRGTKRLREDLDSSAEEPNNEMLKISIPHDYESYQTDDSDDLSDLSSCDSEEMVNEDSASNHSHSFSKTADKQQVTRKRMKNGTEKHIMVTKHRLDYSDSEDEEEHNNYYGESGPTKKTDKTCRMSCAKMGRMLKRIHRDNTLLSEKVLAVEQQSLQKLSEISTVLTSLANYMMNTQNSQRPGRSTALETTRIHPNEKFNSQRHHHGLWSDATKKEYDS